MFTEANVVLPATLLETRHLARRISTFWAMAWIGNLLGAILTAHLVAAAQTYPRSVIDLLGDVIDAKLQYADVGGAAAWFQLVLSGVLANWLVGMAAFFATMGRTIFGKYIPILLAVTTFVAAGSSTAPRTWATSRCGWPRPGRAGLGDGARVEHHPGRDRHQDRRRRVRGIAVLVRLPAVGV